MHLGIDLIFSKAEIHWDNASIPMKSIDSISDANIDTLEHEIWLSHDPDTIGADRIQSIIDAKYTKTDLTQVVKTCIDLTACEQIELLKLLQKFEDLFDGTLGSWKSDPIDLELQDPNCKPYHTRPYPVPHSQEQKLRDEVS